MRSPLKTKRKAYRRGYVGEWLAMLYLRGKGYRILKRRYKTPLGEIDILASHGATLVAVEVKTRPSFGEAAFSFTPSQAQRIERALTYYLSGSPHQPFIRYDLVLIVPWRWPHHIKGAWRPR